MLIDSIAHLPFGLAIFQEIIHGPTGDALPRVLLRWSHFVAGITWIGILYFFNLVNVNFMKALDAPTKGKVIPELMPRALWFFRWGAFITVFVGLVYYAMYILKPDVTNANTAGTNANVWVILGVWMLIPLITFAIEFFVITKSGINDGRVLAVIVAVLAIAMSAAVIYWLNSQLTSPNGDGWASNKALSIGIGGALGIIMLFNVWGIIWPAQKRIIAWTKDNAQNGTPIPPESAALGRKAFLASRTNAWLSLPMLFFMSTSHGDYIIFGR
jgi:uncharacterized membrane protein